MQKQLKIIIFDGTFKTTPFINRLVKGLVLKHQVYIIGFNEYLKTPIKDVHYIGLGSNSSRISFVLTTLKLCLRKRSLRISISTVKNIIQGNRKILQQQNLSIVINKIEPDIIHLQWPSLIPWVENILINQSIPIVLSQRGTQINVIPFINSTNFNYLQKWYPKLAGFHSVSKAMGNKGDLIYKNPNKIERVLYTGVNLNNFIFNEKRSEGGKLSIISVGRSHWIKGYDIALKACKKMKELNVSFQYTIIGIKEDEELLFLRKAFKLEQEVNFIDRLPQHEVFKKIQESELFLLPSIEEGIANVAVEAMVLGTPVISTSCGGMAELIEHNEEGWLVPPRDAKAMATEIMKFNKLDKNPIEKVIKKARRKIENQFAEAQMLTGIEELYLNCISKKMNSNI